MMARLTLKISDEAHRKLKTLAAYCGLTMKDFLLTSRSVLDCL